MKAPAKYHTTVVADLVALPDDRYLELGLGGPARMYWETADGNANALVIALPEGGATDVPVLVVGDASVIDADLGWFNGVTEPRIAVVDDDADSYVAIGFSGDDDARIILGGSAALTLPAHSLAGDIVWTVDSNIKTRTDNAAVVNFQATENGSLVTVATLQSSATPGYAGVSFSRPVGIGAAPDARASLKIASTVAVDVTRNYWGGFAANTYEVTSGPYAGEVEGLFGEVIVGANNSQDWTLDPIGISGTSGNIVITAGSSGTITGAACFSTCVTQVANGAAITNLYGYRANKPASSTGKIANAYAVYVDDWTAVGTVSNWAIYVAYNLPSYFGGSIQLVRSGTNSQSTFQQKTFNDQASYCNLMEFYKSHSDTEGATVATPTGSELARFNFYGVNTTPANVVGAYMSVIQNGAAGATQVPTDFVWATSDGVNPASEKMRLSGAGNLTLSGMATVTKSGTGLRVQSGVTDWNGLDIVCTLGAAVQIHGNYDGSATSQPIVLGVYAYRTSQLVLQTSGSVTVTPPSGQSLSIGKCCNLRRFSSEVTLATTGDTTPVGLTPSAVILSAGIRVSGAIADLDSADHHVKLGVAGSTSKYCDVANGSAATSIAVNKKANYVFDPTLGKEASALILTVDGGADNTPSAGKVEVEVVYVDSTNLPDA